MATSVIRPILDPIANVPGPDGELRNLSQEVAQELVDGVIADLQPRSTVERLLAEQLAVAHAQIIWVHTMACATQQYDRVKQLLGVAGKLQANFRKTVLTVKELRSPSRQIVLAQQANIAQQQIVN